LQVIAGAPAERGGLRVDDEVVTIDGRTPVNAADIVAQIRQTRAGASVAVVLRRDGAQLAITLTPEVRPDLLAMVRRMLEGKPAPEFAAQQLARTRRGSRISPAR
jgi:C-terminal processing protease CtpA/Prc